MTVRADENGVILDLRCHDGNLMGVNVRGSEVDLRLRRINGEEVRLVLGGVRSFALNRFLQGNIVDAVYVWPVAIAPSRARGEAAKSFSCKESFFDEIEGKEEKKLFVLECSYGAEIYALIQDVSIRDCEA